MGETFPVKPKARVISNFDPNDPDFKKRTRYLEWWGGLGDLFNHMYWLPCYRPLEQLGQNDKVFVFLSCHNPSAWEIFAWHRFASQITVCQVGYLPGFLDKNWRRNKGIPIEEGLGACQHDKKPVSPVIHYPPEEEIPEIEKITRVGPYVVFSLTASTPNRDIPMQITEDALGRIISKGFQVVVTGRDYVSNFEGAAPKPKGREVCLKPRDGLIDMVNRLSVPSTAKLVEKAAGVLTCHAALCMLSWHMNRPTFLLMDQKTKDINFPPKQKFEGYAFGANRPENAWLAFQEYTPEWMDWWIGKLVKP